MKRRHKLLWSIFGLALAAGVSGCHPQNPFAPIVVNEDSVRPHILPIEAAVGYTKSFRTLRDSLYRLLPSFQHTMDFAEAEAFNRDAVAVLLNQKDVQGNPAAGVRIYMGTDRSGQVRMVLVPYDRNGNDIINQLIGEKAVAIPLLPRAQAFAGGGQTVENGQRCPPACSGNGSGLGGN